MRLLPRSIRLRLVLLFAAGSLVALVLSLSLLYVALQGQLSAALDADLQHRSDDVLAGLRIGDLSAVFVDPMAQVYSGDGAVVFSSTGLGGRLLDDSQIAAASRVSRSTGRSAARTSSQPSATSRPTSSGPATASTVS